MKTLDEVIKNFEICRKARLNLRSCDGCTYAIGDNDFCIDCNEIDVLHYLKEFQDLSKMWNNKLDKEQENPPLDWETLKQMEGKPLWVEYNLHIVNKDFRDKSKRWCIIREIKPWHDTEIIITENGFILSKNEQIKCWQAYRKERS